MYPNFGRLEIDNEGVLFPKSMGLPGATLKLIELHIREVRGVERDFFTPGENFRNQNRCVAMNMQAKMKPKGNIKGNI